MARLKGSGLGGKYSLEATPLVKDGIMYMVTLGEGDVATAICRCRIRSRRDPALGKRWQSGEWRLSSSARAAKLRRQAPHRRMIEARNRCRRCLSHRSYYPANPLSLDPHCSDKARLGHRRVVPETPKANRWRAVALRHEAGNLVSVAGARFVFGGALLSRSRPHDGIVDSIKLAPLPGSLGAPCKRSRSGVGHQRRIPGPSVAGKRDGERPR
jgi:hypothetical protein